MPNFGELGKLVVRIEADSKKLQKGLKDSQAGVNKFNKNTARILKSLGVAFATFGVAASLALSKVVRESVKFGVELDNMNKLVGISAARFAKLAFAVEQEHGSVQALTRAFPTLAQRMRDAQSGLETYVREFEFLGVEFQTAEGRMRDVDKVLLDFADSFEQASDKTAVLGSLTKLLGLRVAKDLIPMLKLGKKGIEDLFAEFETFGFADEEINRFAVAAKEFDDKMTSLTSKFKLAGMAISAELLPAFSRFVDKVLAWDAVGFARNVGTMADAFIRTGEAIALLLTPFGKLVQMMQQFSTIAGVAGFFQVGAGASGPAAAGFQSAAFGGEAQAAPTGAAFGTPGLLAPVVGPAGGATEAEGAKPLEEINQGFDEFGHKIDEAQSKVEEFSTFFKERTEELGEVFVTFSEASFDVFGQAMAGMMVAGESFSDSMKEGFKSLAQQFIAAIISMIARWAAFIAAIMAIAVILAAFGVPIGETFKTAFALARGETAGGQKGAGLIKGVTKAFGFRQGGALMAGEGNVISARDGLAIQQLGRTGAFGESGIPAVLHPNEAVIPLDKLSSMMAAAAPVAITINGYNRDPRELAEMIGLEVDRRRRAP